MLNYFPLLIHSSKQTGWHRRCTSLTGSQLVFNWTDSPNLNKNSVYFRPLCHVICRSQSFTAWLSLLNIPEDPYDVEVWRDGQFGAPPPAPIIQCFRLLVGSQWRGCRLFCSTLYCVCVWCTSGVLSSVSCLSIPCEQHFV